MNEINKHHRTTELSFSDYKRRIKLIDELDDYFKTLELAILWDLSMRHMQGFMQFFREKYDVRTIKNRAYLYNRRDFKKAYKDHIGL